MLVSIKGEKMAVREIKENEFGDKIGFNNICAGILFWVCVAGLAVCACCRGIQEIKKHNGQTPQKAKVVQIQNQR